MSPLPVAITIAVVCGKRCIGVRNMKEAAAAATAAAAAANHSANFVSRLPLIDSRLTVLLD